MTNDPKHEHTGSRGLHEHEPRKDSESEGNPEGVTQNQDPGHRQKQNQNDQREDPLAS